MAIIQALHNVCIAKVAYGLPLGTAQLNTLTLAQKKKKGKEEKLKSEMFPWKPAEEEFNLKTEA